MRFLTIPLCRSLERPGNDSGVLGGRGRGFLHESWRTRPARWLASAWVALGILLVAGPASAQEYASAEDAARLDVAEMAYWASLEDYGSPRLLQLAAAALEEANAASGGRLEAESARWRSLQLDVEAQQDMAHDTLRALFPGYRLLREGLAHEVLVDEPWVVSTVNAAAALRETLRSGLGRYAQFDLRGVTAYRHAGEESLVEPEERPDLLNEAFYALAENSRVWLDALVERSEQEAAGAPHVLLELSLTDGGTQAPLWAMTATADLVVDGQPTGDQVRSFGFALDRRPQLVQLVALLLLLGGLAVGPALLRRPTTLQVAAAGGAYLLGIGVTAALLQFLRDRLPSPDSLAATSLWGPLFLAGLSTAGPLIALNLAPSKLRTIIPEGLDHWVERDFGAWPALCGGGAWLLGATLIESGLAAALALGAPWLVAQHHASTWLEKGGQGTRRDGIPLACALAAALVLAVLGVPADDWSPAGITWAAGLTAVSAIGAAIGVQALASVLLVLASVGLLTGGHGPLIVMAAVPMVPALSARLSRSREGRGAAGSGDESSALLLESEPGTGTLGLPARLRSCLEPAAAAAPAWGRILVRGGTAEDRELVARSAAHQLVGASGVARIRQDPDDPDGLSSLRSLIPGQSGQVRRAVTEAAAMVAGLEPAERTPEEDQRALAVALHGWIVGGGAPGALVIERGDSGGVGEVLALARLACLTSPDGGAAPFWEVHSGVEPESWNAGAPGHVELELGAGHEELRALRVEYMVDCLGVAPDLAELIEEESREEGLGLTALHRLAQRLVEEGDLAAPVEGRLVAPPFVRQRALRGRVREVARECVAGSVPEIEQLEEAQLRVLSMAAHLGSEFSVDRVARAAGLGGTETTRLLAPLTSLLEDPDHDGQMAFADPRVLAHLRQIQRIPHAGGGYRWRQTALDDLRSLAAAFLEPMEAGCPVPPGHVLRGLGLIRSRLAHGGDPARSDDLLRSGLVELLQAPERFRNQRDLVVDLLGFFLAERVVPEELEIRVEAARLRWEYGTARTQDLPLDSAWDARTALERSARPEAESHALRVEIACRLIDVAREPGDGLDEAERQLEHVLGAKGVDPSLEGRAHYERARLDWLLVKSKEDPDGRYSRALEGFERATALSRAAGDLDTLRRALRTWAEALGIPPAGKEAGSLEERTVLLEQALEVNREMGDAEGQAMVLGTMGRAHLYRVFETPRPSDESLQASLQRAREAFIEDRRISEETLSIDGVVKMDTMIAQTEWQLGQFDAAHEHLVRAEATLVRMVGEGISIDLGFILAGQVAEAARRGAAEELLTLQPRLEACREALGPGAIAGLRGFYAPHLNFLEA